MRIDAPLQAAAGVVVAARPTRGRRRRRQSVIAVAHHPHKQAKRTQLRSLERVPHTRGEAGWVFGEGSKAPAAAGAIQSTAGPCLERREELDELLVRESCCCFKSFALLLLLLHGRE
jgi:hypothetical protein